MPTSRKRHIHRRAKERTSREARAKHYEKSYADLLLAKDITAWLAKQQAEKRLYCASCKGRVKRKRDLIECQRCGRSMSVADYVQQQEANRVREEGVSHEGRSQESITDLATPQPEAHAV